MKRVLLAVFSAVFVTMGMVGGLQGAPLTFSGEDQGLGEATPLASHPNADAARDDFFAFLVGVGTETFEVFPSGTPTPLDIVFPGTGTATLTGSGSINTVTSGTNGFGRFPISGTNYWESGSSVDFGVTFSDPVAAFGFYGTDIGDFDANLILTLEGISGTATVLDIPHSAPPTNVGGSVLYFGVIDVADPFTMVTFSHNTTSSRRDTFGFDDFTIASPAQISSANQVIPEPDSLLLLGSGLAVGGLMLRRRKSVPARVI